MKARIALLPVMLGGCMVISSFGQIEVARDGRTQYVIVEGAAPTAAESLAARDLAAYLGRATGATFRIVAESAAPGSDRRIFVGATQYARRQGLDIEKLGPEESVIRSSGLDLVLTGGRPRGTLYAVYEFLETTVGCLWLDEHTEIVPAKPNLMVPRLDVRSQPAFWDRVIYTYIESDTSDRERIALFRARNKDTAQTDARLGFGSRWGSPRGCHTFCN